MEKRMNTREKAKTARCPTCRAQPGTPCIGKQGKVRNTVHASRVKAARDPQEEYRAYLRSAYWRDVKRRYRASDLPQACVVCGDPRVDLHHKTYERRGREELTDLEPRCRKHHEEVHAEDRPGG
jgi:hypothetical protein